MHPSHQSDIDRARRSSSLNHRGVPVDLDLRRAPAPPRAAVHSIADAREAARREHNRWVREQHRHEVVLAWILGLSIGAAVPAILAMVLR